MPQKFSILPKEKQRQLRWLLLSAPLFFLSFVNTLAMPFVSAGAPFASYLLSLMVLPALFFCCLGLCLSQRLSVGNGVIEKGIQNEVSIPLNSLVELSGSSGSFDDDFKDSLLLRTENGQELQIFVDEYDEQDLRRFLSQVKAEAPNARYTYAEVISFESRGLLQFLMSTLLPDGAIIKMNRSPLAETVMGFINSNLQGSSFWTVYFGCWLGILVALAMHAHSAAAYMQHLVKVQWNTSKVSLTSIDLSQFQVFIYRFCEALYAFFVAADLSILAMLWTGVALMGIGFALVRVFSPVFVFVDSKSIGQGMRFFPWEDVESISLNRTSEFSDPLEGILHIFHRNEFNPLSIDLSQIAEPKRRSDLLRLVEKYAAGAKFNAEFLRATNTLVDIKFTDIWLQSGEADDGAGSTQQDSSIVGTELAGGAYEVESLLGYGGQGVTYLAQAKVSRGRDAAPAGQVVIKEVVLPTHAEVRIQQDAVTAFERGAELLQKMTHPQIVKLWDHFIENGRAYLILEYIQGRTLRSLVEQVGVLPLHTVLKMADELCDILQYLHSQNPQVIHCDLAPDNLILTPGETIKLVDFDVARVLDARRYSFIAGRPSYTPPEQFRGKPCVQSDIYALGAIMHFLLYGNDPAAFGHEDVAPNVETRTPIDQLISRCMSFEVDDRPPSAEDLRKELRAIEGTICGGEVSEVIDVKLPEYS
jgi:hypothetical protein